MPKNNAICCCCCADSKFYAPLNFSLVQAHRSILYEQMNQHISELDSKIKKKTHTHTSLTCNTHTHTCGKAWQQICKMFVAAKKKIYIYNKLCVYYNLVIN